MRARLSAFPRPRPERRTEACRAPGGYTANGALPLSFVTWGPPEAPAIVLLHGLRAYAHWFDEFAEAAGNRFRLIALDQRGRGASGWAPDGRYDTDSYVADVESLKAGLGLDRFALVGHSMGGTNAVAFAARHPGSVSALVIVDQRAPSSIPPGWARIGREVAATPAAFPDRDAVRAFLRTLHARASDRSMETRLDWMLMADAAGVLTWRLDPAIFDPAAKRDAPDRGWTALAQITCPTLVVRGVLSDLVTQDCADRMAITLRTAERAEIPGAAHMVLEDNPEGFATVALPFLDRVLTNKPSSLS